MVKEALKMLDELIPALERAKARREPGHGASLRALDAILKAVVATRAYLQDEMLQLDGSRESARFSALARLWQQATKEVTALQVSGPEKALLKGEGWPASQRWSKLEKQGGWSLLQGILAHCEWLLAGLPAAPRR